MRTFHYDPQFVDLNTGTHRRPAPLVGTPSLVWHRGFWRDVKIDRDTWVKDVDHVLAEIFLVLWEMSDLEPGSFSCKNFDETRNLLYLFISTAHVGRSKRELHAKDAVNINRIQLTLDQLVMRDVFTCCSIISGVTFTARATLHSEYWDLSIYGDWSNFNPGSEELKNVSIIYMNLEKIYKDIIFRYNNRSKDRLSYSGCFLYDNIVGNFKKLCNDITGTRVAQFGSGIDINNNLSIGRIFYDSFFLSIGLNPQKETTTPPTDSLHRVTQTKYGGIINRVTPEKHYTPDEAQRILDAVWPMINHINGGINEKYVKPSGEDVGKKNASILKHDYGNPEYAVTLFHGMRSLHISSLGRSVPENIPAREMLIKDDIEPLIHVIITIHPSRWQFGRLIDRLLYLETSRLAALWELIKITEASKSLKYVQKKIDKQSNILEIESNFKIIDSKFSDGIKNRIERSRYYVRLFDGAINQMRTERIEGFQTYGEFINRRLRDRMEFIHRVGLRYDDIRKSITLMTQIKLQEENTRQTTLTNLLLKTAELGLFFPITYYSGSVIIHSFDSICDLYEWKYYIPAFSGYTFGAIIALVLINIFEHRRKRALSRDKQ